MNKCKCSLRERAVGDGCEACNPAMAEELRREARVARLVEALEEVASFPPCEPWRDITRAVVVARAALDEWRK